MILSKSQIIKEIELGNIIADGVLPFQISEQSIDVSLHDVAWRWNASQNTFQKIFLSGDGHTLYPQKDFILGIVDEWVGTKAGSKICCEFKIKSTPARLGLDNALSVWIEEGYFSRLCLELYCHIPITIKAGDLIGQYVFHRVDGEPTNYVGEDRYQTTSNLEELKAEWKPEMVLPKTIKNKFKM
jgi:deoxycytidine triphosphate deaminase